MMKAVLSVIIGFIGGFVLGVALSSLIGVAGIILLDQPIGIKYLSFYTGFAGSVLAPFLYLKGVRMK